jgi:hypothetical protein
MRGLAQEAESTKAALVDLTNRIDHLKLKVEHIEASLRDLSDEMEALLPLNKKVSVLEIELANCRNLAEIAFQAVEVLQLGGAQPRHKADVI